MPAAAPDARKRVLLVEDDLHIADILRLHLRDEGYAVEHVVDGKQAIELVEQGGWDAMVLDLMLPGVDGLEVCRRARAMASYTPIIITSARSSEVHRILGLEIGADDYLAKPFRLPELLARVRALLRRTTRSNEGKLLTRGDLVVDTGTRRVTMAGRPVELTRREFELLELLMQRPGQVFSREQILSRIWGFDFVGETNVVDVHVSAVRGKLGDRSVIRTVRGVGYALET